MATDEELTAQASQLTNSVTELTASVQVLSRYGKRSRQLVYWTIAGLVVDIILTVVVGLLFNGQQHTNRRIDGVLHSDCPFFMDLGTVVLPKQATTFGIKIVADSRAAYYTHGCVSVFGTLGKPDPRLLPYLPPEAK